MRKASGRSASLDLEAGQRRAARLLAAPALAVLALTVVIPLLFAIVLSFTRYDMITRPRWVGLDNYRTLLTDPVFGTSVLSTLYFAVGQVLIGIVAAFFTAMLFNRRLAGGAAMRTVIYLPQAMSYVTVALLWSFLYDPANGPLDAILRALGLSPLNFLTSTHLAMPAIIAMSLWRNMGYFMIIILAGLKAVPGDLIEAAQLDGAGWWRRLAHVIVPQMSSTLFFVAVTWFLGGLQMFTQSYVMTQGGPVNSTRTIVYSLYDAAFTSLDFGRACAVAVLLFLAVAVVAVPVRIKQQLNARRLRHAH
ncbi:ABC transporter permease [Mangrovactinospora gilvigrisea]|uniref:ABC transporter permease n=1 Tax=Mangrovactinospora gilvigrisea TaxID=1428644 RepID=A0A1J7CIN0_9ACTN|nr:sugar ABC transporter permease [Mangrovactinospora gilvigrisea]OIV39490.1 ABC transporter permease [Mangrovactinospora gilvigrisea]